MPVSTPIALIIFNRPHLAEQVFAAIAAVKPSKLFVIADGPRFAEESDKCKKARSIVDRVDWNCEVQTNFSEENLGCRDRVVSGINWVFSKAEDAIVLEDDCVPHPSFFHYCETLLQHYRNDDRIMEIGGANYQNGQIRSSRSYYFSKYSHLHGWATWRRAWQYFDKNIQFWPALKKSPQWATLSGDAGERKYWTATYDRIFEGKITTVWDYQWQLMRWARGGLVTVPRVNLVSNIGYGPGATHTIWADDKCASLPTYDLGEISHPDVVTRHEEADRYMFGPAFRSPITTRVRRKIIRGISLVHKHLSSRCI